MFLHSDLIHQAGIVTNITSETQLGGGSIDLINDDKIIIYKRLAGEFSVGREELCSKKGEVFIPAGSKVLMHSKEVINMPKNCMGWLSLRSTAGRSWINHSSALLVQPGFQGTIAFEFFFESNCLLKPNESFMQLAVAQLILPENPKEYTSRYQGHGHLEPILQEKNKIEKI